MELQQALVVVVVFLANTVEAITGFAGTMLSMPAAIRLIGVDEARVVLNMVALFVSLTIAVQNRGQILWREVRKISLFMLAGAAAGRALLSLAPLDPLLTVYGLLIIAVAVKDLLAASASPAVPVWLLPAVLLGAGMIHGMFLSGGALLVLYAAAVLKEKGTIRATLAPVWLILNSLLLAQDIFCRNVTGHSLRLGALCLIPVALALYLGDRLHRKVSSAHFFRLTDLLLVVSGLTLLF